MAKILNRESVQAFRWVPDAEHENEDGFRWGTMRGFRFDDCPGAYKFYTMHSDKSNTLAGIIIVLPGVGQAALAFAGGPDRDEKPHWNWNGSQDRPTLTPSIRSRRPNRDDAEIEWHGWLRDGRLVSC